MHGRLIMDRLQKTEFEVLDNDIIVIRHLEDAEITREDIRNNLTHIKETCPGRKLPLIDHENSYSLSFDALDELLGITCFKALAPLVYDGNKKRLKEGSVSAFKLTVPYKAFEDIESAIHFLRSHE